MKKILILIPILLIFITTYKSFAQKPKKGIEYKKNINKLVLSNAIVWYGVDFSRCKLTDAKWIAKTSIIKDSKIPEWIAILNKEFDHEWISSKIKNKIITSDLNSIQMLYKTIKDSELVSFEAYSFPIDSIALFVKYYQLPQANGTGLVLIIESMNQPERYITGYWTFFDIQTREILYATKMKGLPGSRYGYTQYWKAGLEELYAYYFRNYYKVY